MVMEISPCVKRIDANQSSTDLSIIRQPAESLSTAAVCGKRSRDSHTQRVPCLILYDKPNPYVWIKPWGVCLGLPD